jgi:Ca2+:H+ antiporter
MKTLTQNLNINLLLLAIPLALIGRVSKWSDLLIFVLSGVAIIPLAGLVGHATETIAERTGPQIGGLLNATLGNAAELIITIFALRQGLVELVRASIIGSILGNILLIMGLSMLLGGLRHGTQKFDRRAASINATLMVLAFITLAIPSFFDPAVIGEVKNAASLDREKFFTGGVAVVMLILYGLSTAYTLRTPKREQAADADEHTSDTHGHGAGKPVTAEMLRNAAIMLVLATLGIVLMSETLVGTVEHVTKQIGLSELFVGIIVVPLIGNVAEHVVAIQVAVKNRMDLSMSIALGSSLQIALFVAPMLVFISLLFPTPLLLIFNRYELIALAAASAVGMLTSQDGESNWLEGAELLALYLMIALAFFVIPSVVGH